MHDPMHRTMIHRNDIGVAVSWPVAGGSPVRLMTWLVLVVLLALTSGMTIGQDGSSDLLQDPLFQELPGFEQFDNSPNYSLSGNFVLDGPNSRTGKLNVQLDIKLHWHGYSQNDLPGQKPTRFHVAESPDYKVTGNFVPNVDPVRKKNIAGEEVEEFEGSVVWSAPIELAPGVDPESLEIEVRVDGQVCNDKAGCVAFDPQLSTIRATFDGVAESAESKGVQIFRAKYGHAEITGRVTRPVVHRGETTKVELTAKMDPGWHIYRFQRTRDEKATSVPTMIYFTRRGSWSVKSPVPSSEPVQHEQGLENEPFVYYHEDSVTWSIELTAPEMAVLGEEILTGVMVYQVCEKACDMPQAIVFEVPIKVVPDDETIGEASPVPLRFQPAEIGISEAAKASKQFWETADPVIPVVPAVTGLELVSYLLMAFAAGLILNAMPCVLPVIGLKVMSFVQQAGESRLRVFLLNLVFSLGLMTVFWILASLAAFFGMGWGDWLTRSMLGSVIITAVVFAFGLSMLGIWEIPIPGISGSVGTKAQEEGLLGAYVLGILTTVLATPCTGPLLVPATTIIAGQPTWVAYLIFTFLGLGMASPYLLIGAFPNLISWLPRPGAWMNTFKQVTGFILMGTVVFLLAAFAEEPWNEYMVAMLTLLLFIALGCWWIGRTSLAAERSKKLRAWAEGLGIIAVGSLVAFTWLVPPKYELEWQEYSTAKLNELRAANRIVFIDFTGPN